MNKFWLFSIIGLVAISISVDKTNGNDVILNEMDYEIVNLFDEKVVELNEIRSKLRYQLKLARQIARAQNQQETLGMLLVEIQRQIYKLSNILDDLLPEVPNDSDRTKDHISKRKRSVNDRKKLRINFYNKIPFVRTG